MYGWYQYALALMSAKSYAKAFNVLNECLAMEHDNPKYLLLCAKICLNHMTNKVLNDCNLN